VRVVFHKTFRIQKHLEPFVGRLRHVMIAARTDPVVLLELQIMDELRTGRALLPKPCRQIALLV
jgi:hypothetical protein